MPAHDEMDQRAGAFVERLGQTIRANSTLAAIAVMAIGLVVLWAINLQQAAAEERVCHALDGSIAPCPWSDSSHAKAVDPVDSTEMYPGTNLVVWVHLPRYSRGPTTLFYTVRNYTEQNMNFRVECSLDNPRLYFHNVYSRWIDNIEPHQRGFGKAELDGFVDAPPQGLHCRITDGKPTPAPVPNYRAGIKVPYGTTRDVSLTLHYQLTNSLSVNADYQIECLAWSTGSTKKPVDGTLTKFVNEEYGPVDVTTQWVTDVPATTEVEGTVYFPRGYELLSKMWLTCRIIDAQIGHAGH
jgi:hypothetical protein